jgi:hypothetical protein
MKTIQILVAVGALALSSCATKVPFTQAVREKYQLTDDELKQLQFYASHDIVLTRNEKGEKSKTTEDGKLKITTGQEYEQVLIKKGTPGVVEKVVDSKRIAVSFESDGARFIVFGDPNDKKGNYTLLSPEWKDNRAVLKYGAEEYYANQGASNIYVMFKMNRLNKIKKETRVAKGRKL